MGLGYVGLTLALILANFGFKIIGIDKDITKIQSLKNGNPTIYEEQIEQYLNSALSSNNIQFEEQLSTNHEKNTFIISVGTPINENHVPQLENLKNVAIEVGKNLKKNDLVILRSTVPVGTTRNFVKPLLEKESGLNAPKDFHLVFAPERTLQGKALKELTELSQIIGGLDDVSVESAASIFNKTTRTIVRVSNLESAEMIKLLDNTYRDITISIGNLFGKICDKKNLDAKEIIEAANYGYSRNKILFPGAGVGGGCLVKDPYLLLDSLKNDEHLSKLVLDSRIINDSMIEDTKHLIDTSFKKTDRTIANSKILILGFAFKGFPNTDDIRFSPSIPIVNYVREKGADLYGFDPVVSSKTIESLGIQSTNDIYEQKYDCVIILNNNPKFKNLDFDKLRKEKLTIIDGWYMYDVKTLSKLGINYFALGMALNS
jgi:UDP-N-acetyl-D-mannosaminuronic acid dehydrogenase